MSFRATNLRALLFIRLIISPIIGNWMQMFISENSWIYIALNKRIESDKPQRRTKEDRGKSRLKLCKSLPQLSWLGDIQIAEFY